MSSSVFTHSTAYPSATVGASGAARDGEGADYTVELSNASKSSFKGQTSTAGGGTRHAGLSGTQAWDATTYHGLLAILKDPKAPIAASCAAVEECLALNKDNLRGFFEQCFAPLMANVFGYDQMYPGQGGWVNRVAFEVDPGRGGRGGTAKSPSAALGAGDGTTNRPGNGARNDVLALRRLFAPKGRLFMAMYNADCDGTIKYHFPLQRLPGMSQLLLKNGHPLVRFWPQYGEQVMNASSQGTGGAGMNGNNGGQEGNYGHHHHQQTHVHVSVLQYFCYWFAFYANNALSAGSRDSASSTMHTFGKRMLHPLSRGGQGSYSYSSSSSRNRKSMYLVLLRDLLHEFMPRPIDTREDEGLGGVKGSKNPLVSSYQDRPGTGMLLYSILIEFWLKDAYEPWLRDGKGKGVSALWGASYDPPVENLLEAIEELTKYVLVYQTSDGNVPAQGGTSWLAASPVLYEPADMMMGGGGAQDGASPGVDGRPGSAGHFGTTDSHTYQGYESNARFGSSSASTSKGIVLQGPRSLGASASLGPQAYARQLYRMMHRALSSWPDQRSIKPFLRVFMVVLEPWQVANPAIKARESGRGSTYLSDLVKSVGLDGHHGARKTGRCSEYTTEWEHHVLAHLPFYLDLVPMFLELSVSRVAARGEPSVQDVLKVLKVFEKSQTLVQLLRDVEGDVNRCYKSDPRRSDGQFAEILPWAIDQAENWRRYARTFGDQDDAGSAFDGRRPMSRSASRSTMSAERRVKSDALYSMFSLGSSQVARNCHDILAISAGILKPSSLKALQTSFDKVLPKYEGARESEQSDHDMDFDGWNAGWGRAKPGPVRKINRSTWGDAKFKGNDLSKPKTSTEITGLVDLMVFLSERINTWLTFDMPVSDDEIPETIVAQWLYDLRRRGTIVNLRPLADVRNVIWLTIISFLVYWLVL